MKFLLILFVICVLVFGYLIIDRIIKSKNSFNVSGRFSLPYSGMLKFYYPHLDYESAKKEFLKQYSDSFRDLYGGKNDQ